MSWVPSNGAISAVKATILCFSIICHLFICTSAATFHAKHQLSAKAEAKSEQRVLLEHFLKSQEKKNNENELELSYVDNTVDGISKLSDKYEQGKQPVPSLLKSNDHMVNLKASPYINKPSHSYVNGVSGFEFIVIVSACAAVAVFGIIGAGFCFYRLQKNNKAAAEAEYPAYGVTGPNKDNLSPSGDRKLAQSAQMYHYQHQKQQMIALEKAGTERNQSTSDVDSEEENEEGDYTVYECPGLAPTGEMEVKNPLFNEQPTPTSPGMAKRNEVDGDTLPEKESTKM